MAVLITGFCPAHGAGTVDFSFGRDGRMTPRPCIYRLLSPTCAGSAFLSRPGFSAAVISRVFSIKSLPDSRAACNEPSWHRFLTGCLSLQGKSNKQVFSSFCRLKVINRFDTLCDLRRGFDLRDDFLHALIGHRGFIQRIRNNTGGVNALHFLPVLFHGKRGKRRSPGS